MCFKSLFLAKSHLYAYAQNFNLILVNVHDFMDSTVKRIHSQCSRCFLWRMWKNFIYVEWPNGCLVLLFGPRHHTQTHTYTNKCKQTMHARSNFLFTVQFLRYVWMVASIHSIKAIFRLCFIVIERSNR